MDAVTRKVRVGSSNRSGATAGATDREAGRRTVIVVGAGVSGCACAAAMAAAGLHVVLMNSVMDRVGLPAYGPDLVGDEGGWDRLQETLRQVPSPLREVWLDASTRPASGEAILNIDRRRISIETKRVLERIPGLELRQGFVTDLRVVDSGRSEPGSGEPGLSEPGLSVRRGAAGEAERQSAACENDARRVQVETIFGEVFEADTAVVAVGMSLGGSTVVGTATVEGGRYGEPASEGLWAALVALGAAFQPSSLDVGPRVSARDALAAGWPTGTAQNGLDVGERESARRSPDQGGPGNGWGLMERLVPHAAEESECWPAGYPPAVHRDDAFRVDWIVMAPRAGMTEEPERREEPDHVAPVLSPDGAATAELYVAPGSAFATRLRIDVDEDRGLVAACMPLNVSGKAVAGLGEGGRMSYLGFPGPLWVVGRAAGAREYAASLASGVAAAQDIIKALEVGHSSGEPAATQWEHGFTEPSVCGERDEGGQA